MNDQDIDPFDNMDEPEIFFDGDSPRRALPDLDLTQYTEEEFRLHYKATKQQYVQIRKSVETLKETSDSLSDGGPFEVDPDLLDNMNYLIQDLNDLLEQMHLAAEWEREKQ